MHQAVARFLGWSAALGLVAALVAAPQIARGWSEDDFARRPVVAYPIPTGRDEMIGALQSYTIRKGDTLLDIGRWFGVSAREISDANDHIDWWTPPAGKTIVLPTEHILPSGPRAGIVINVPELRLYYYYPPAVAHSRGRAKLTRAKLEGARSKHAHAKNHVLNASYSGARVVYTFPVGLGRYDWRTPVGKSFRVTAKEHDPPWIVPQDIYEEHLERDGYAEHMIPGGDPDNPEGHWRLDLNLPEYAIHGTNNPWGVGMEVSHGCIRLSPEAIDRLWHMVPVGTTGRIVYQPVKFGWHGGVLYVEVHEDLYGMYPGLWRYAVSEARRQNLLGYIDTLKLEKAIEEKTGVPTYVMPGPEPPIAPVPATVASSIPLPPPGSVASAPDADSGVDAGESGTAADTASDGARPDENVPAKSTARAAAASSASGAVVAPKAEHAVIPPTSIAPAHEAAAADSGRVARFGDVDADGADAQPGNGFGRAIGNAPDVNPPAPSAAKPPAEDETRGWVQVPSGALPIE
ncbi:MAG TPA: L,D-transpeptidase family protein [Candidatus Binataceae bacterium]|nr:L,D-transpeptidase family protein [Candidatus Binataceae bacterium]